MNDEGIEIVSEDVALLVADADKTVAIWAFADAPSAYRQMSNSPHHDETFIALVPKDYAHNIDFIANSPYFGCNQVDIYTLESGQKVYIGS
jgi:hypothetical protein